MGLKMKELVKATGENKSTILFYIKEGLLPQPYKLKPNVHLYDESSIHIIEFIKYLQKDFGYSIKEIKQLLDNNRLDLDGSFEQMVKALEIATIGVLDKWYDKETFLKLAQINTNKLDEYIEHEFLYERIEGYSPMDLKVVNILKNLEKLGLGYELLDSYIKSAKEIAKIEDEAAKRMFSTITEETQSHYELIFDVIIKLKPYLYNMQSILNYYRIKQEEK